MYSGKRLSGENLLWSSSGTFAIAQRPAFADVERQNLPCSSLYDQPCRSTSWKDLYLHCGQ